MPEGTILGWVEEAPEIFSLQEVLQQQLANHAGEVGDEQAKEIHAVLEAAGKARSEAISHEPAFDCPTSEKTFRAPGFAWRVLHHPSDTTLPLTQIIREPLELGILPCSATPLTLKAPARNLPQEQTLPLPDQES